METSVNIGSAMTRLRSAGLIVSSDANSGFHFHHPTSVPGNRREGYKQNLIGFKDDELGVTEVLDAPRGGLFRQQVENESGWAFRVWDWCPGPGPGDFERRYSSLEVAIDAVLEYYFGDPAWMCDEYDKYRRKRRCT